MADAQRLLDHTGDLVKSLLAVRRLGRARGQGSYAPLPERVIYLLHNAHPFHNGGYAVRGQGILRAVRAWGFDAQAVVRPGYPWDRVDDVGEVAPRTVVDGVPYHYPDRALPGLDWTTSRGYLDAYADHLVARCRELRPAVIHAASFFQNGIAAVHAGRRLGIPVIYEMRGLSILNEISRQVLPEGEVAAIRPRIAWEFELELEAARKADHVLAITAPLRDLLVDNGVRPDRISLLRNGIDLGQFTPRPPSRRLRRQHDLEGRFVIGFIGTLEPHEGLDDLIRSLSRIAATGRTDWRLLVVGDGDHRRRLEDLAKRRGIEDKVIFTGRVPHARVPDYYSVCDLMVYPRRPVPLCEAISPIKPLEPMALGIPVLCADVGALREMIVDGVNGHCFPKGDVKALAERLLAIMDGRLDTAAVRAQSRAWVERHRDWRTLTRPVAALYRDLYLDAGGRQVRREQRARLAQAMEGGRPAGLAAWQAGLDPALAGVRLVDLTQVPVAAEIEAEALGPGHAGQKPAADPDSDRARLSWALTQLPGGRRLLEVGPAGGLLLGAAGRRGLYGERMAVTGEPGPPAADPAGGIETRAMPLTALDLPDRHFDAVCCLGPLARLPETSLEAALAELRRVCAGVLIVMVPFREPPPIGRDRRSRFDEQRLLALFPRAGITLLVRRDIAKSHWAACIERMP